MTHLHHQPTAGDEAADVDEEAGNGQVTRDRHRPIETDVLVLLTAMAPALLLAGVGRASGLPQPIAARPDAPPRILYVHFSATTIRVGNWWSGRVVTTTNVASPEFRAPSFSFVLHRTR